MVSHVINSPAFALHTVFD